MHKPGVFLWSLLGIGITMSLLGCNAPNVAGSGSETNNEIAGVVRYPDGTPAAGARILVHSADYLPGIPDGGENPRVDGFRIATKTGPKGRYHLSGVPGGLYLVEIVDKLGKGAILRFTSGDSAYPVLPEALLQPNGIISGRMNVVSNHSSGYFVRLFGMERIAAVDSVGKFIFRNLPAGEYDLVISRLSEPLSHLFYPSVRVVPDSLVHVDIPWRNHQLCHTPQCDSSSLQAFAKHNQLLVESLSELTPQNLGQERIRELHLQELGKIILPETLTSLDSLKLLDLRKNKLDSLPEWITGFQNLLYLYLDDNELPGLPLSLGLVQRLRILSIAENQLRYLPEGLGNLRHLVYLGVSQNQLREIPASLGLASALEELDLSNNLLSDLPVEIGNLSQLRVLHLQNNQLSTLSPGLFSLHALQSLDLRNNELRYLPSAFSSMKNLNSVRLEGNHLCEPQPEWESWADSVSPGWRISQQCSSKGDL